LDSVIKISTKLENFFDNLTESIFEKNINLRSVRQDLQKKFPSNFISFAIETETRREEQISKMDLFVL